MMMHSLQLDFFRLNILALRWAKRRMLQVLLRKSQRARWTQSWSYRVILLQLKLDLIWIFKPWQMLYGSSQFQNGIKFSKCCAFLESLAVPWNLSAYMGMAQNLAWCSGMLLASSRLGRPSSVLRRCCSISNGYRVLTQTGIHGTAQDGSNSFRRNDDPLICIEEEKFCGDKIRLGVFDFHLLCFTPVRKQQENCENKSV